MRSIAVAFLAGVLFVQAMAGLPSLVWALLIVPLAALAWRFPVFLIPLAFIAGVGWTALRAGVILNDALAVELERRDLTLEGFIADLPEPSAYGTRVLFDVKHARLDREIVNVPRRVQLSLGGEVLERIGRGALQPGEAWRFTARLKRPHGFQNPGGFDYEAHLFQHRIRARGYVRASPPPQPLTPQSLADGEWRYAVDRLRQRIGERMRAALPENRFAGVLVALANGDNSGIDQGQWQIFRRTGTLHLVAISGLHISLIAGIVFFLARRAWALGGATVLITPAPVFAAWCALAFAALYAALAGFTVPTQRALLMLAVALGGLVLRRRFEPSWLLACALLAVLIHDPLAVMASGFWLSFAAVAVIIFVIHAQNGRRWGFGRLVYLQWAIALGLTPLLLWWFQQTSLSAPLANLLAVPSFDLLVVPATLAGVLFQSLGLDAIAQALFMLAGQVLEWLWRALEVLAEPRWLQWIQHRPPTWTLLTAGVGVLLLLAPRGLPGRWLGAVWLAPLFLVRPPAPAAGEIWFSLLDVDQGLAAVVRTARHTLVYDTGARFSPTFDAGAAVVVPYLRSQAIPRVDVLMISHGDNDHIGGLQSVLAEVPVAKVLSNVTTPELAAEPCLAGRVWRWDQVEFRVLAPQPTAALRSNNGSCVLHVKGPFGALLLPGDIEAAGERALVARAGDALASEILVAPHHGSRSSSGARFIDTVSPRYALFAAGYANRYGHPHPMVAARYRERGIETLDSAAAGAIELRLRARGIELRRHRDEARRYWFAD